MVHNLPLQPTSYDVWDMKYRLKNKEGVNIDNDLNDSYERVAKALAVHEVDSPLWEQEFLWALQNGATPAGRIMSNSGAEEHKPSTSTINCTVSAIIEDSLPGIMNGVGEAGITLGAGCGIGYEFSTLRPKDAYITGAGASTSGPLPFMDIYDKMCFTISSAGGRRGAQMATFAIWHPDVEDFITAKREDGRFRQFNCSLLIDDEFMKAVKENGDWSLVFPVKEVSKGTIWKDLFWDENYCEQQGYVVNGDKILCEVYRTIKALDLWNKIMDSTYNFAEPGNLFVDEINRMNNNYFCEKVRATNPCGEQPLPPYGACLLGSVNLTAFIDKPFTDGSSFEWSKFKKVVSVFTRMLDNVVDNNNLPLKEQRDEIAAKRRHGMGYLGLGSALTMLGMEYGDKQSLAFTEEVTKLMTVANYSVGVALAREKGEALIMKETFNTDNGVMTGRQLWIESVFMKRVWAACPGLKEAAERDGCRFTHATSIAPTGTISLSLNNNASNGIEPTFAHKYTRNMIVAGKSTKQAVDVYSYEMLLYKKLFGTDEVPQEFSTSDTVSWKAHVDIQAAAQKWIDSSISKTINVPTDMGFDSFKDIYMYAYDKGLKGCTTFRFNPEAFQGVLVKDDDLKNTKYRFCDDSGKCITINGNNMIEYQGDVSTAANLYDALKEGYHGKL